MIFPRDCYFYCDTEAEVKELFQMLEEDGLEWQSGARLTSQLNRYLCRTYYRVPKTNKVTYGSRADSEADWPEYSIKDARCFFGSDISSCEVPDINDLL